MIKITGTLLEDQHIFKIISRSILHNMRNVIIQIFTESHNAYFTFNTLFENRDVYELMWKKHCRAGQATNDNKAHAHTGYLLQKKNIHLEL